MLHSLKVIIKVLICRHIACCLLSLKFLYFFILSNLHTPPPFHKHESRFEREQKIRVGSVDSYKPGETEIDGLLDGLVSELELLKIIRNVFCKRLSNLKSPIFIFTVVWTVTNLQHNENMNRKDFVCNLEE